MMNKICVFCCLILCLYLCACSSISRNTKLVSRETGLTQSTIKDKQKIIDYLLNKKYIEFENEINELLKDNKNAEFLENIYSTIIFNNDVLQNLNELCLSRNNSHIAYTVRGAYYIAYAWSAVDKDSRQNNPEDAISVFYERLNLAKSDLEKAYELNPNDPHAPSYLIIVARGLNLNANYMETQFQRAIKVDSLNRSAHINKLNYYARKWYGSHEEMIQFAIDTIYKSPEDNDLGLVILSMAQQELVDSKDLKNKYLVPQKIWTSIDYKYQNFTKNNPDNQDYYVSHAEFAMLSQKYDVALNQFEIIRNKFYPSKDDDLISFSNFRAYRIYAYSLYGAEKYKEAVDPLKRLIKVNKNDSNLYKLIAYCYNKINDEENVIKYAREMLNLGDTSISKYREVGYLLYELKKYKEAIAIFQDNIIKYYGDDSYSYQYLAFCYSELNQYEECIEAAKKYLETNPDSEFFKKWLRKKQLYFLYKTKKFADAVNLANEMIKDKENADYAYRIMAYCYDNQENYKKAADAAEKVLEINPDYKVLKKWIRKRRIYFLYENHYSKKAIEQTLAAINEFGEDADFCRILSQSYYNIEDYVKCVEYGEKSLTLDPKQKKFEEWFKGKLKELN